MTFTADHQGFYRNGEPFQPHLENTLIRLPAHLSSDLDWSREKEHAQQLSTAGKPILWEIDLGLESFEFMPGDTASFYSFSLAIEEFAKQIWPTFQEHTFGVSIYRGVFPPTRHFPKEHWETTFADWGQEGDYELFCVQMLSDYLHRLISFFPDAAVPIAFIDASQISSLSKAAQFFSTARFEHLHPIITGAKIPFCKVHSTLGVLLPCDAAMNASVHKSLENVLENLNEPFRIVPEEKLTEQWDGLDKLIVISEALSPQGKRKLQGFEAAGGEIISL